MDTNQAEQSVDVGGTSYTVLCKPNLSNEACRSIFDNVNQSWSGNNSDIYDTESVIYALNEGMLSASEQDAKVLNAIKDTYIEIS